MLFSKPIDELREVASAARLFSYSITEGIPVLHTFKLIGRTFPRLKTMFDQVHDSVRDGECMTASMRVFPAIFPVAMLTLFDAGEDTGDLDDTSLQAAALLEGVIRLRESGISHALADDDISQISDVAALHNLVSVFGVGPRALHIAESCVSKPTREVVTQLIPKVEAGSNLLSAIRSLTDVRYFSSARFIMIMEDAPSEAEGLRIAADELADFKLGIKELCKIKSEKISTG